MSKRSPFDHKYWNLAQASVWVEYREKKLVEDFDAGDRDAYIALGMYPSMWPANRERHGAIEDLRRALEQRRIVSYGYRNNTPGQLEEIPAAEWTDLAIRPPLVCFAGQPNNQPWSAVRLLSADMKRFWRSINEVSGRSKYDWDAIRAIFDELQRQNSEMSQNELILELQGTYEDRLKKDAPSRSSIQRKINT
ncbi:hypothetical protein C1J05_01500 [Sulfitobacter sp. JL08]|uniref:hypothetical protein n=1 Tax=Sulfitobacter sp. JL08 TaxID=2070369 RepID=UPI000E0AAB8F|nr:hypothetical protein [Sulfitobacter sp. JL08]AXI53344.1 hypothetical protein C1J05_01500 [Sulfitobacter sp. JL08]